MDEQIKVQSKGKDLYGMIHYPETGTGKYPGVILLHGFTGTSVEPHRFFVKIARDLVKRGFAVLRFDFSGAGQSDGGSEDMDFIDWTEDAKKMYAFMKKQEKIDGNNISFAGLSMGSAVLLNLISDGAIDSKSNVFMAPGVMLTELIPGIMEKHTKIGKHLDVWGNRISIVAMEKASKIDLFKKKYENCRPSLILHCKDDDTVPYQVGVKLHEMLRQNNVNTEIHLFESGAHTFSEVEIEEEAIKLAGEWIERNTR